MSIFQKRSLDVSLEGTVGGEGIMDWGIGDCYSARSGQGSSSVRRKKCELDLSRIVKSGGVNSRRGKTPITQKRSLADEKIESEIKKV